MRYAGVIVPLKFGEPLSYCVAEGMELEIGTWVKVPVGAHEYLGVVDSLSVRPPEIGASKLRNISEKADIPPVPQGEITFWKSIATYYLCSLGEVFKAACPVSFRRQVNVKPRRREASVAPVAEPLPTLSQAQSTAYAILQRHFSHPKASPALLHGVTGSGKTEIYMTLASQALGEGGSVLYLVPEIAMSGQLQERLSKVFGARLLTFHSKLTAPRKKAVFDQISSGTEGPFIVLGTRSALFLPIRNLRFIIVDEEHDSSYKQEDPSPRYNGRDAALLKAAVYGANVLLGSATPSYETLYNIRSGKYLKVDLLQKYSGSAEPEVRIVDMLKASRLHNTKGSFAMETLNAIRKCVEGGGQVLVFRSRRAYAAAVQCSECGSVPLCPRCNVPLTYHKFNDSLVCHYCGRAFPFSQKCGRCGSADGLVLKGSGTEKIEEELAEYFPSCRIARFDADIAEKKSEAEKVLKSFACGETDILVGTHMITKGFDFDRLSLTVVVSADSLLAVQDFRADERALQILRQFRGRAGRRKKAGKMLVQTARADHPVFARLAEDGAQGAGLPSAEVLAERRMFGFPPYVRMISITVKDRSEGQLWHICRDITDILSKAGVDFSGPMDPAQNFLNGMHISVFWIKLPRTRALAATKASLYTSLTALLQRYRHTPQLTIDVDPL